MNREWLRDIRKKAGKSQKNLAKEVGISQVYCSAIELGLRGKNISVNLARKFANALNFDLQKFYEN